jgi:very-short-patch-repair endonuclease
MGRPKKWPEGHIFKRICRDCGCEIICASSSAYHDSERENRKFRKCGSGWTRGLTKNISNTLKEMGIKVSKAMKGRKPWNAGLTKKDHPALQVISEKSSKLKHTNETKLKISNASKEHWKNEEYRTKVIQNATIGIRKAYKEHKYKRQPGIESRPEKQLKEIFLKNNISFIQNKWLTYNGITKCYDFLINDKTLIEVDGIYWHAKEYYEQKTEYNDLSDVQKSNILNDKIKDNIAYAFGYKLIRIWEDEINNEKISKILRSVNQLAK